MENTSKNTALVTVSFPNRNTIVGPSVLQYAERYQTLLNRTAESILALTETVYEAKSNLTDDEFNQFKDEVGLKSKATISKFLAIGEKATRLRPYANRLPQAWTTLYKLATLETDQFSRIVPLLTLDLTAKEIDNELNPSNKQSLKSVPEVTMFLQNKSNSLKKDIYDELQEIADRYNIEMRLSKAFASEVAFSDVREAA